MGALQLITDLLIDYRHEMTDEAKGLLMRVNARLVAELLCTA